MREFKFRIWDGRVVQLVDCYASLNEGVLEANESGTLMQFTGLKDKNGVEIYEGDILRQRKNSGNKFRVIFNEDLLQWWIEEIGDEGFGNDCLFRWAKVTQVVGNIYENPELLK